MRSRGRPLPRAELANRLPWIGDPRIEEIRDEELKRYVRVARVLMLDRPRALEGNPKPQGRHHSESGASARF